MVQQDARWTVTEGAARQPPPHTRRTHVRLIVRLAQDRDDVVRRRVHYGVSLSRVCVVVAFHLARLISAVLSILRFWAGSHRFLRVGSCSSLSRLPPPDFRRLSKDACGGANHQRVRERSATEASATHIMASLAG